MTDALAIDLFIQDFVNTNKLLNQRIPWETLVNRRFAETGATRVFSFESDGIHHAIARFVILPDSDWLRIELTHSIPSLEEGTVHRFDCLRMLSARTHTDLQVEKDGSTLIVRLATKHRGLANLVFVIRDGLALTNPFLV